MAEDTHEDELAEEDVGGIDEYFHAESLEVGRGPLSDYFTVVADEGEVVDVGYTDLEELGDDCEDCDDVGCGRAASADVEELDVAEGAEDVNTGARVIEEDNSAFAGGRIILGDGVLDFLLFLIYEFF